MEELAYRLEKRFRFSAKELFQLLITVVVAAFIISFRKWGEGKTFNIEEGLLNLLVSIILLFIFLFIHFSVQKIIALKFGYTSEYKYWVNGLLLSLILCFFTYGYFPLFFTGTLFYDTIPKLRMGVFRGGVKHKDLGVIAFAGPLSNIIIVGLLALVYIGTKSPFFYLAIIINLLIAIFSLLPIPTFEKLRQFKGGTTGLYIFIASRWAFVLVFVVVLAFSALILLFHVFSYIIALLVGIITAIIYYSNFEMEKK